MGFFSGLLGGGNKSTTSNSTTNYTPNVPDWLKQAYQTNTQSGIDYGNYISGLTSDQLIAPFSQDELSAFDLARQGVGQYSPVFNSTISTMLGLGQQAANGPSADQIQSLMNPYVQDVLDSQRSAAVRQADAERNQINQNLQQAGAFGGSRQAVQDRELNQQLADQLDSIQANGMYNAFNSAMGQYNTGLQQQFQAAGGANNAALQAQGSNLQDVQTLQQVGQNERQMQQNQMTTNYQQPMAGTNYIQQLLNSVPQGMYGYTSNTNSTQTQEGGSGSLLGSLLGAGLGLASLGLPGGGTIGGSLLGSLIGGGSSGGSMLGSLVNVNPAYLSTTPGTFFGSPYAKGGLVKGYADGGLVIGGLGPSSIVDATSTTATNPLPASKTVGNGRSLLDLLLGLNAPEADHSGLATIKAIQDMEAKDPANLYGTGTTATPDQENNLERMMLANPGNNNNSDFQSALDYISSLTGGSGDSQQQGEQIDPTELAADAPDASGANGSDQTSTTDNSPLATVLSTAGTNNLTTNSDAGDALDNIMKNTNIPLLAMGLTMLGSHGNFADQLSQGGLKATGVMLEQQQAKAKAAQQQQENDTKKLQVAVDLAKAKSLDGFRNAQLKAMQEDKNLGRTLQKENLDIKRQALQIKQNTKPPTQKDALNLAQRDPRYLMAASKAQKGDTSMLDSLQKEYYDRLNAQYVSKQNSADSVINSVDSGESNNKTVNFADIGKDNE